MKKFFLYSLAIVLLASCDEKKVENAEQNESALSELRAATVNKKYELLLPDSLKYADDRFFSELDIFISWPEKINGKTPAELQQRILAKAFGERKTPYKNLEEALNAVKSEPLGYADEPGVTQKEISAIPDSALRISTLLVEAYPAYMNNRLWTYYVVNYTYYAGAAHGLAAAAHRHGINLRRGKNRPYNFPALGFRAVGRPSGGQPYGGVGGQAEQCRGVGLAPVAQHEPRRCQFVGFFFHCVLCLCGSFCGAAVACPRLQN